MRDRLQDAGDTWVRLSAPYYREMNAVPRAGRTGLPETDVCRALGASIVHVALGRMTLSARGTVRQEGDREAGG